MACSVTLRAQTPAFDAAFSICLALCRRQDGKKLGYDTEAFAIYDTMQYVKPPIHTICVGTAWGEAAMLLASGAKVCSSPPPACRPSALPLLSLFCRMSPHHETSHTSL